MLAGANAIDEGRAVPAGSRGPAAKGVSVAREATAPAARGRGHRALKIVGIGLAVLVGLVLAAIVALNIYVRAAFGPFYDRAEREFPIPGVGAGFVCQDLDHLQQTDAWLFSGYMADHSPSPLYRRAADGTVARLAVETPDGDPYVGHGSAITSTDQYAYLACEGGYLVLDAAELAEAPDGATVRALARADLDFSPAFMNIEGDTLLTGEFYYPGDYETPASHRVTTPDGTENPAVMYAYALSENAPFGVEPVAERVYSIPGMIQGVCTDGEGRLVLSQSYGLATSHLYVYDVADLAPVGTFTADGEEVPLYCLDGRSLVEDVEAPPMAEGIESLEGRVYVSEESASNKYLFGKLYGAGEVYSLVLEG